MRSDNEMKRAGSAAGAAVKSKKKKVIAIAAAAILVIAVVVNSIGQGSASAVTTEIKEAQAKTGNVAKTISASGSLSDDASINIKVPEGVILNDILVSVGDKVKKGDVLAKVDSASVAKVILELKEEKDDIEDALSSLSDTSDTTSDDYLKKIIYDEELSDIESAISKLEDMLETGTIKATKNGTITGINAEEGEQVTSSAGSTGSGSSDAGTSGTKTVSASESTTASISYASVSTSSSGNITTADVSGSKSSNLTGKAALLAAVTGAETETGEQVSEQEIALTSSGEAAADDEETDEKDMVITNDDLVTLLITQPQEGAIPQQRVASTSKYNSRITWNTDSAFSAGKTYTAVVELTSKNGYSFDDASAYNIQIQGGTLISGTPTVTGSGSGNRLTLKVSFQIPENSSGSRGSGGSGTSGSSGSDSSSGGSGNAGTGSSGVRSGGSSGSSGTSVSATTSSSSSDSLIESSVNMATVFQMSSDDEMTVTVSVDEADINSVKNGQTASVTLDAIEGETFDGEITKVSQTAAASSGGSVKYEVTITLDKTEDMKAGMTASSVINIEEANDVIVIPSAAINEKNGETFVYTKKDGDELSGKTEITTGLSNGSMVEVTGGLEEGDTVYYEIRTKDSSSGSSNERGGMPDMGNGNPGEMPQGMHDGNGGQGGPGGNGQKSNS